MHLRNRWLPRVALCAGSLAFASLGWCQTPAYDVVNLGTLGGTDSYANGINDSGQVVGDSFTANDAAVHAFLYSGTSMQDLGNLGGDSHALAINSLGRIAGYSATIAPNGNEHATYYDGSLHDLGTLGGQSHALGINNVGTIVGDVDIPGATPAQTQTHAAIFAGGMIQDLGTLGGPYSGANAINNAGHIVGHASVTPIAQHAFLYTAGDGMQDLGTLPGDGTSNALGINAFDQIVGYSQSADVLPTRGFIYNNGVMQDVGTLGGDTYANAINDLGQVVGSSMLPDGITNDAFLYDSTGLHDLNSMIDPNSGWQLETGNGINNLGQIVGTGYFGGTEHAFLLTPTPEPGSAALLAITSLGLLGRRRGRD